MRTQRWIRAMAAATLLFAGLAGPINPTISTTQAATTLDVCGNVAVYVEPTVVLAGMLTIGPVAEVIAAGTTVPSAVAVGADICLRLTIGSGLITDIVYLRADATSSVRICGTITAFAAATSTATGSLTINGRAFTIAIGETLPVSVRVGADLCLDLDLNALGQIRGGSATANATATVKICGSISAFTAATLTSYGSLTIGGRTFVLALGSDLPTSVRAGADLCLTLVLNGFGQVQDGTAVANVSTTVQVCGTVTAFAAATLTQTGSLTIDGRTFVIGLGGDLPASVDVGAALCLTLHLNAFGQVQDGTAVAFVTSTIEVCGQVTAVAAAGSTSNGSLTIAGVSRTVAAGTSLSAQVQVGAYLKLRLTLDVFGRIDDDIVLAAGASLAAACGTADPAPSPSSASSTSPGQTQAATGSVATTTGPGQSAATSAGNAANPSPAPGDSSGTGGTESIYAGGDVLLGTDLGESNLAGGPLPDTASFARTGTLVMVASVPLLVIGGVLLGAWLAMSRRRRDALVEVPLDAESQGRS